MVKELNIADVSIDVVFKDIKNVHLSVYPPTGRVRVSAPRKMDLETIRLFAVSKISWIRKHQNKIMSQDRETPREYLERESHYLWGQRYLLKLQEKGARRSVTIDNKSIELIAPIESSFEEKENLMLGFYRKELREAAYPYIEKWEKALNVEVSRFYIQKMKTKWGSSTPQRKTIRLNLDLAKFSKECLSYVILHEIAHFIVPNHGQAFIDILDQNMPDWQSIRAKLNEGELPAFIY